MIFTPIWPGSDNYHLSPFPCRWDTSGDILYPCGLGVMTLKLVSILSCRLGMAWRMSTMALFIRWSIYRVLISQRAKIEKISKKENITKYESDHVLSSPRVLNYIPRGKKCAFFPPERVRLSHPSNHRKKPVWNLYKFSAKDDLPRILPLWLSSISPTGPVGVPRWYLHIQPKEYIQ